MFTNITNVTNNFACRDDPAGRLYSNSSERILLAGEASRLRVPLHAGYLEQPQNSPRALVRLTMGAPHLGQLTFGSGCLAVEAPRREARFLRAGTSPTEGAR